MYITNKIREFFSGNPSRVKIGKKYVGDGCPVFIIAEIGINHNGDINIAKKLIDEASRIGVDAVKFQKRDTNEILTKEGLNKPYTSPHAFAPTYGEHRNKLEFGEEQYKEIKKYCDEKGVLFFASVWDHKSADFMASFNTDAYKIPSADLINLPLLEYVAGKDKPVLLSTGMNTDEEIDSAVQTVLRYNNRVIIFHCLSLYPAPEEKLEMGYMDFLSDKYAPLPVGYSGHERDLLPTLVAVSRGAKIIERHFTLDKKMKGSDHAGSLEPQEFEELIKAIKRIENIIGSKDVKRKVIIPELIPLRDKLAKSVVSKCAISKGQRITREMLTVKGPGTGLPPREINNLVGKIAGCDIEEDTLLPKDALNWRI